jgi:hypothetical protein
LYCMHSIFWTSQDERSITLPVEITAVNDPPEIRLVPGGVLRLAEVSYSLLQCFSRISKVVTLRTYSYYYTSHIQKGIMQ